MDTMRFASPIRLLGRVSARRRLLLGLAGAVRRKRPRKKPRLNAFGCVDVGKPCRRKTQCCSGICEGKKGKKRCTAHDTGGCAAGTRTAFCGGTNVACSTSDGGGGFCSTTTGNAGYCHESELCAVCKTDADCASVLGAASGHACVLCPSCTETGGTMCAWFTLA